MKYLLFVVPLLAGCAFLRDVAGIATDVGEAAGEAVAEAGGDIVATVGRAASGDPLAIVAAIVGVVGIAGAIVTKVILKRRARKP